MGMRRLDTPLAERLGLRFAIVQAPMASVTTPALVAAASDAGALGSFGGAMTPPDVLRETIRSIKQLTVAPFAVNLFAELPRPEPAPGAADALRELVSRYGKPGEPRHLTFTLDDQLTVVLEEGVPVFSFTFGIIDPAPFREAGTVVIGNGDDARRGTRARGRRRRCDRRAGRGGRRTPRHVPRSVRGRTRAARGARARGC